MEMPIADAASSVAAKTAADAKVTHTGGMETVAGYACEHITVASAAQTVDICMAKGLGGYVNPLASMPRSSEPAWQRMLTADGGFPLKVTMPDGRVPLEVVKIEKKKQASDLFSVPPAYMKMGRGGVTRLGDRLPRTHGFAVNALSSRLVRNSGQWALGLGFWVMGFG